jgi:hypothetical protein
MKKRWMLAVTLILASSTMAVALAAGGPNFDFLTDADRKGMQERFTKDVWPLMLRGEKNGCVGCHNGKINGTLKMSGQVEKDFRMLVKDGFMIPGDSGSLLAHIKSKDRKKRMPPPGKGEPWTQAEMDVLHQFVVDLDKKQQKKAKSSVPAPK